VTLMPARSREQASRAAKSLSLLAALVVVPCLAGAGSASAEEPFKFEYLKPDKCKLQPIDPDTGKGGGVICTQGIAEACTAKNGILIAKDGQPSCRTPVAVSTGSATTKK
jgi:hypothetical protein